MSDAVLPLATDAPPLATRFSRFARRNPTLMAGAGVMLAMFAIALIAPLISGDPMATAPARRFLPPSLDLPFGTDHLGRDVYARTVHGARVSLIVGFSVAALSVGAGLLLGMVAGYVRALDSVLMRLMDGLMAIPAILLAIAMVALARASVLIVIFAITLPEIPRVVRLVRAVVLSVRERAYVEAAIAGGTPTPLILMRHIVPNTIAPLIVQATYIAASAILVEASLSFLGAGTPPDIPSWGNMIAQSRHFLARAPWTILFPGAALALVVLAINLVGDGLRDHLDPRLARRMRD